MIEQNIVVDANNNTNSSKENAGDADSLKTNWPTEKIKNP